MNCDANDASVHNSVYEEYVCSTDVVFDAFEGIKGCGLKKDQKWAPEWKYSFCIEITCKSNVLYM